jgi:hypothetical protein
MVVTVFALLFSIAVSSAALAWGFLERGFTSIGTWMIVLGIAWLIAAWQRWDWTSALGLLISVCVAAFGLWVGFTAGWMFAGAIFALFAWDLSDFRSRLTFMSKHENTHDIERRHIARISLLALAGLIFASITMLVRAKFNFEWMVLLVAFALFGLTQLVSWFKRT